MMALLQLGFNMLLAYSAMLVGAGVVWGYLIWGHRR